MLDIVLIFFSYVDKKARVRFDGMRGMYDCLTAMSTRRLKNDESDVSLHAYYFLHQNEISQKDRQTNKQHNDL